MRSDRRSMRLHVPARGRLVGSLLIGLVSGGWAPDAAAGQVTEARYRVQALATDDLAAARAAAIDVHRRLEGDVPVYVVSSDDAHRVRAGDYETARAARRTLLRLRAAGYPDAWLARAGAETASVHLAAGRPLPEEPVLRPAANGEGAEAPARVQGHEDPVNGDSDARADEETPAVSPGGLGSPIPPSAGGGGGFHGVHEAGDCDVTFGWAWDADDPDEPVDVEILDGTRVLGIVRADRPRRDLADAGKGDGRHGFSFTYPEPLAGDRTHRIRARIVGSGTWLVRTPVTVDCAGAAGTDGTAAATVSPPGRDEPARIGSGPSAGSPPPTVGTSRSAKRLDAVRFDGESIVIDGRLDDDAWSRLAFDGRFAQKGPDREFPAREETEVAFAYDDEALYVGARMRTRRPEELRALVRDRDDPGNAERVLVSLDTYRDGRTAYTFGVTTGGVRLDHYHPRDDELARDDSFDPVWEARSAIDSAGWTAELRIPFSELRFDDGDAQTWGLNVRRWSPERFLNVYWVVVPLYESGWISRFGELGGLDGIRPDRRIAIRPYALAGATMLDSGIRGPTDPASSFEGRVGGDLSFGLGPSMTLEATVNPDFGQIEADPAEVNLTQFETFFDERRPFFTEGSQLLRGNGPQYFYSRRIGAVPSAGSVGGVTDPPSVQTILGAAKATGRLESGISVGGLTAATGRELRRVAGGDSTTVEVAPPSVFVVGRVEKEFGPAGSTAGLTLTGVRRQLDAAGPLATILPGTAITGGGDWRLRLGGGDYEVGGHIGFSNVTGDSAALLGTQRASARYFQRPDATHVRLDPGRTSLQGWTAAATLKELAGQWLFEAGGSYESPGFELQDAGILRSADDVEAFGGVTYRQPRASGPVREYSVSLFLNSSWNTEGVRQYTSPSLYLRGTLPNLWRAFVQVGVATPALSDDLTRGGPLMGTPFSWSARAGLSSRFGAPTQWSASLYTYFDEFGGWSASANAGLDLIRGSQWELSLHPGVTWSDDSRQFFGTFENGPEATYGSRYVFSRLDRSEIYARLRVGYALTPDLTLRLYAEPFASSGRFHQFGQLDAAGSSTVTAYGSDGTTTETLEDGSVVVTDGSDQFTLWNSDFRVRSFRSNAVLRWEWRRGSTLHLIWQQNRWSADDRGDHVGAGSLFRALGDDGENILVAKISYWLPFR